MVTSDEMVKSEVLAAANALCAAIGADDEATIDSLLAEELYYRHSNGLFDLKPSYMEKLRLRKRVTWLEDPDVRPYGDFALIICRYVIDNANRDGSDPHHHEPNGLQVWTKRDGRWQLLAHQGTLDPK